MEHFEVLMKKMRSQEWYGKFDKDGFIHRSWMKNLRVTRPRIRRQTCHWYLQHMVRNHTLQRTFERTAEYVKRGVWEMGSPLEFPAISLGETQMRPRRCSFAIY